MSYLKNALNKKIGLGTAPLGNMFRNVSEEEALATIQTAWDHGIRYYDTAPFYGFGLSEIRLGEVLSQYDRSDYILSSKVGRIILDEKENKSGLFEHGRKNKMLTDYSEDGTLRSIEDSLKRLKTDHLDFVFVHDISPDFLGDEWTAKFEEARKGAFPALDRLRDEGVIKSWGLGVNTTEPIEKVMELEEVQPNLCLSATQYTLMQHEQALERMMPMADKKEMGFVIGSPYNSGALLGGDYFDYAEASDEKKQHARELKDIAEKHGASLKAAALQFSSSHPAVEAVIPGSTRTDRIKEDLTALEDERIPHAFWEELVGRGFVSEKAPLPKG
ncbi:aldo/keto reductase [Alteribacter keqinensis]|uniref:Aldo/keto reductase n=1 Tax=Alteribacter keqinensis TaxID=2483800 RepID=A0A3M7TSZ3_9BACI|nr:aldo/keto reductase [Alteribacter keqinensis]RNA68563.1 aldo/keto reductase [Alteribacter keqinensis]